MKYPEDDPRHRRYKEAEVKAEALVKWEELYTRLWNIESRLDKLEEKNDAIERD